MSQDFLSQDEVDALLKGVTGDSDEPQAEESADGVRPYNLATQERIVRGRMPTLELIHERFARNLRIGLFNFMHRSAEISVGPIRVQKYGEFVRNLVVPTNLNLVQATPLRGTGLIVFDPNLVFLVVRQHVRRRRTFSYAGGRPGIHADRTAHHPRSAERGIRRVREGLESGVRDQARIRAVRDEPSVRKYRYTVGNLNRNHFHAGVRRRDGRHAYLLPVFDGRADTRRAQQHHAKRPCKPRCEVDRHAHASACRVPR